MIVDGIKEWTVNACLKDLDKVEEGERRDKQLLWLDKGRKFCLFIYPS